MKMIKKISPLFFTFLFFTSNLFAAATTIPAGKYEIDSAHSKVGFEISHLVISSVEGKFKEFSGNIVIADKLENSKVDTKIEVKSIDTSNEKRDTHLKSPDFFDAEKIPNITFVSKKITLQNEDLSILGTLTLHGVSKEVTLNGKYLGTVKDQSGTDRIAFQASTKIKRSDYGLKWSKLVEAGPVVGEEVTISLKLEAKRTK